MLAILSSMFVIFYHKRKFELIVIAKSFLKVLEITTDCTTVMGKPNTSLFLGPQRRLLSLLGIWLYSKRSLLWQIYMIFVMSTQYSFVFFELVYIVGVWGDISEVSEASYLLFTQASVCYKTTAFMVKEKNLEILLDFMESEVFDPQSEAHVRILWMLSRRIRNLCFLFLGSASTTCFLWAIIPLFADVRCFPFKIWMPVSVEASPSYELGYLYQVLAIYISAFLFMLVDSVALCMTMFGCAQLEIIMNTLEQVQSVPGPRAQDRRMREDLLRSNNKLLAECIRRHQEVIRFMKIVEDTFHTNIFFQLSGSVLILCNIALRISMVKNDSFQLASMLAYMVTMMSQVLLYCWIGHELTTRSEVLRDCVYQCPWYEQDMKYQRGMLFAMERMKIPIIFKAGHYVPLSRPTFVAIIRCSYSYFAVLNSRDTK